MTQQMARKEQRLYDKAQKILLEEDTVVFPKSFNFQKICIPCFNLSIGIKNYPRNVMSYILFRKKLKLKPKLIKKDKLNSIQN